VAKVRLLEGRHADLAAALYGLWAEGAVPPLLLGGEEGNAVFDAELASAVFEAPAGLVADDQGATGAGEGECGGSEAAVAKAAAATGHRLKEDDGSAGEESDGNGEPGDGGKWVPKRREHEAEQGGRSDEGREKPARSFEKGEEARGKGSERADEKPGWHSGDGRRESSEELDGEPEEGEPEDEAGLMKTYGHALTA
jgi:hypothetical protein